MPMALATPESVCACPAAQGLRLDDADSGAVRAPVTALEAGADAEPLSGSREAQQQPSNEEAVRNLQDLAQLVD